MVVFFFLLCLELICEFLAGELYDLARVVLPIVAILGGMLVPVQTLHSDLLIYYDRAMV